MLTYQDIAILEQQIYTQHTVASLLDHAYKALPNECCGLLLANGTIHPANNVAHLLGDARLTQRTAFMIDQDSWSKASNRESPIIGIYHSHTDGNADMSPSDRLYLNRPELCYLIIGITEQYTNIKLHWWTEQELHHIIIQQQERRIDEDTKHQ